MFLLKSLGSAASSTQSLAANQAAVGPGEASTAAAAATEADFDSLSARQLVRAAKKCSRLYEELERILMHRARLVAASEGREEPASSGSESDQDQDQDQNPDQDQGRGPGKVDDDEDDDDDDDDDGDDDGDDDDEEDEDDDREGQHCKALQADDSGEYPGDLEQSAAELAERESLATELTYSDQSSSRDDQISVSSSSLYSEGRLPELRQRKNLQRLYNIVNEICSSEAKFVATLRLLNVDFRHFVYQSIAGSPSDQSQASRSQQQQQQQQLLFQQAPYDCIGLILRHLPQLQALNESLLAELERARQQWPATQKISHVLVKVGPFLKHYSSYIRDFEQIQAQFNDNLRRNQSFADLIKRFETLEADKCQKLSLQHHLLKPIQRIPQYRLLLQQYLHHLKPDDADYEDTVSALEVVSRVAEHANQSLSEGANFSKLLALQAKIVGKQRDIVQPGRLFVKEGELLKVSRKLIQPRWFVLLNDSLLYLKQIQSSDILYLKYELPLDDCQVELPAGAERRLQHEDARDQLDQASKETAAAEGAAGTELEFNIHTTVRSMTLVAKSRQERDDWFQALKSTISDHVAKRRSFRAAAGGAPPAPSGQAAEVSPLSELVGRKAPIWTPDSRVSTCQLCTSNFSALFRRHHCRACGKVVCSACSGNRAPLIYLKCKAARVCDQCFEQLRANMHLYYLPASQINERELRRLDEHFKTLLKSQFVKQVIGSISTTGGCGPVTGPGCEPKSSRKRASKAAPTTSSKEPGEGGGPESVVAPVGRRG